MGDEGKGGEGRWEMRVRVEGEGGDEGKSGGERWEMRVRVEGGGGGEERDVNEWLAHL